MSGVAPPHHTPEYLAADKGPVILGVIITLTVISTLFVAARVFTRQKILGKAQLDDWLVVVSVVSPRSAHFFVNRC